MNNNTHQHTNPQPADDARLYLAPAKLNLDLRIIGQREDGYHLLESIFTLIDLYDRIWLKPANHGQIVLHTPVEGISPEEDLCFRAAALLQAASGTRQGVDIWVQKNIPMGGGLGGGSSDAALILMALNQLWQTGITQTDLMHMALQLGADVPFFIFGENAFVQGVGEKMTTFSLPKQWYVIIHPPVHVSTSEIFAHKSLTRDSKPRIMPVFQAMQHWQNDMQSVVLADYPVVRLAFDELARYGRPMMSGSGACVFLRFDNQQEAKAVYRQIQNTHQVYCVASLAKHPFYS
ncbi:4-(cytidine 5'-diphospho)-2-C-methyl-D-erythritol kinase [Neisseriaceae bacterium ESL0693]|nr:4-(cytidine 5'-diphospho)-2-C-methyl-D-erythritol kinase [Neisseriaceae bacterium ESL0693]